MRLLIPALALAAAVVWLAASGLPPRLLLAARILDELRAPREDSWLRRATPAPVESTTTLAHDGARFAADLYLPGGARGARDAAPLVLVPGAVEQGKDDPRVAPFARLLARAGFAVVVPDLPSFRTLRVHPDNLAELQAAALAVGARRDLAPTGRTGLFGISYAGGIALLAALAPECRDRVAFVATVGAHADLDTVVRFLATGRLVHGGGEVRVAPDPYGRLVFLKTYEDFLDAEDDRRRLAAMVDRRWRDPAAAVTDLAEGLSPAGRLVYDLFETAAPEEVPALVARLPAGMRRRMETLSPARHDFAGLAARLYLVHDRNDGTIPFTETLRLAGLARGHARVRAIVLESLHHVDPQPWRQDPAAFLTRDLPEAVRLAAWWVDLLGERRR